MTELYIDAYAGGEQYKMWYHVLDTSSHRAGQIYAFYGACVVFHTMSKVKAKEFKIYVILLKNQQPLTSIPPEFDKHQFSISLSNYLHPPKLQGDIATDRAYMVLF